MAWNRSIAIAVLLPFDALLLLVAYSIGMALRDIAVRPETSYYILIPGGIGPVLLMLLLACAGSATTVMALRRERVEQAMWALLSIVLLSLTLFGAIFAPIAWA